jgi:flavin-dependent dehydrogenase
MDSLGVAYERDRLHFYAHPLPLWNGKERVQSADNRILLAGDAAGLINPLFGDGIYHALRSGIIAGTCVAENAAPDYTRRIHAEFAANFDAALKLAGFFYQFSGFVYKNMVRRPGATRTAARLLSGDAVFTDVTGRVMRRMKRAMIGTSGAG